MASPSAGLLPDNLPVALREELAPALLLLIKQCAPQGLWLFGSWARGTATARSDVDLLVLGMENRTVLQAYDLVLEALQGCSLPVQPVVVRTATLQRHGDSPFWRDVRREAIPLLAGCRFP